MKICAICHMKNEDDYNYCVHCGAELDNTSEKEKNKPQQIFLTMNNSH